MGDDRKDDQTTPPGQNVPSPPAETLITRRRENSPQVDADLATQVTTDPRRRAAEPGLANWDAETQVGALPAGNPQSPRRSRQLAATKRLPRPDLETSRPGASALVLIVGLIALAGLAAAALVLLLQYQP